MFEIEKFCVDETNGSFVPLKGNRFFHWKLAFKISSMRAFKPVHIEYQDICFL